MTDLVPFSAVQAFAISWPVILFIYCFVLRLQLCKYCCNADPTAFAVPVSSSVVIDTV